MKFDFNNAATPAGGCSVDIEFNDGVVSFGVKMNESQWRFYRAFVHSWRYNAAKSAAARKPPTCHTGVLPTDSDVRKGIPLATGCLEYFPDALCAVAQLSKVGNDKHNPGQPLHWARDKSSDHADTMLRHQVEHGKRDTDHVRHSAKVAWRALAQLQVEIEKSRQQAIYTSSDEEAMKLGFI